jgi:hypothetical protein
VASWPATASRLWVDGANLLTQDYCSFYTVPTSGGTPQLVAQVPSAPTDFYPPLTGLAVMDASDFYVFAQEQDADPNAPTNLWRVPRAGGAPQVLFTSPEYLVTVPLVLDEANIYFQSGQAGQVFRLPKAGGTLAPLDAYFGYLPNAMAIQSGNLFGAYGGPVGLDLTRYAVDGTSSGSPIDGVGGETGALDWLVNDDQGAYVAFMSAPAADSSGNCVAPACSARLAVAPVPLQSEQVTATGCTASWDTGADWVSSAYGVEQMALDASSVYVLATIGFSPPPAIPAQAILRTSR